MVGPRHWTGLSRDRGKGGVASDAVEPILGVAKIRLSPVHEGVNVTAIGMLEVLGDLVRFFQVIVPEQQQRPDSVPPLRWKLRALPQRRQSKLQFLDGTSSGPRFGAERGRFGRL